MNLRDLKYAVAVADSSHFGHAAERCHVSQPTLSGQIKKLEDELGITLFERTKRSVAITPIGETIVAHAREILEQAETIRQLAQSHQDPLIGPLRIGAIMTLSPYLMPLILKPLRDRLPQMQLVISEEMTETLLERLRKHEIDAALIATPVVAGEFSTIPLFNEPFWLAHPRNHPFQEKKTITQKDLDNTELLLLAEGHCLADQAMEVCHMKARAQQGDMADLHAASLETLLQLVGVGFGCTLVPDLAVRGIRMNDKDIVTRQLQQKDAFRRVSLAFRRSFPRRQALDAFIEVVLDNLPDTVHRLS